MVEYASQGNSLTALLQSWAEGNPSALNEAMPAIFCELRRLAEAQLRGRGSGRTLDPPALVNEAYLRFVRLTPVFCENRTRFFALAATIMRGILVDHVRAHCAKKRGGGSRTPVSLSDVAAKAELGTEPDLLDIDSALYELARLNVRQAKIVEMKFFGGLSIEETAESLNISPATVKRDWILAKTWLKRRIAS
jgi:RNA polymerase sigma-70 factor, ECF subfamily